MIVTHVHLDPGEALLLSDLGLRQNITRSISTNPTVDVTLLSALSTKKLPDWYTEDLAFNIPDSQRDTPQERWMLTKGRYRYRTWQTLGLHHLGRIDDDIGKCRSRESACL
jgi:hypothetical protein